MGETALAKKEAPKLELAKPVGDWGTLDRVLKSQMPAIQSVISKALTPEALARLCLTAMRSSKQAEKVLACTGTSIAKAFMDCAEISLSPQPSMGQCCFVPYKNELAFQVEYRGFIALAKRSGQVSFITADVVRQGDEFGFERGTSQFLRHVPKGDGEATHYYAMVWFKDGSRDFRVMTKAQIEKHRDRYAKGLDRSDSPWVTAFDQMAMKTVIRQLCKYLELSPELTKAAVIDEYNEAGIKEVQVEDLTAPGRHKFGFGKRGDELPAPAEQPAEAAEAAPLSSADAAPAAPPAEPKPPAKPPISALEMARANLKDALESTGMTERDRDLIVRTLYKGKKSYADLSADEVDGVTANVLH
jgi:recombination protein RecT